VASPRVANGAGELARNKWRSSGLSDAHAKALGLEVLPSAEVERLGFLAAGALRIPYFDLKGKPTSFYRLRYLEPLPGWAGVVQKPQRYVQPKGSLNEIYLPPLFDKTWEEIAKDTTIDVMITEGEFKAACAAVFGLACIGLGGVDVWRSAKRELPILPALEKIKWEGRKVVIVYDSDAATNPNVVRAERQLAKALTERGAFPCVASLPAGPEGKKQGLDDFLVEHGIEALKKILNDAPSFPEADALWAMNEEVVYIKDPGIIIVRDTGQRLAPKQFTQHTYANRHYVEVTQNSKGIVQKKRPTAMRWVEWEHRFEMEMLTYAPGHPQIYNNMWNIWPGWGTAPERGDVRHWNWLLDFLFKREKTARKWFEQWCAYPLQNPGAKMYTAVILWGLVKGTGKSLVANSLRKIYGRNAVEIKNKDLRGGFNAWAENRQFVVGDEITGGDRRIDADYVKGLITQPDIRINAKYMPEIVLPDVINYMFTSNHPDAFFIEDYERRYFVHEVEGAPAEKVHYNAYAQWLHDGGARHLFHHLLQVDLRGFDPTGHAPDTRAKEAMTLAGKSDVGMYCVLLREDPTTALKPWGEKISKECDLMTPAQVLHAYDPMSRNKVTANGMARELKRAGFSPAYRGMPLRTSLGMQRLYIVRNWEKWQGVGYAELGKHFDSFFDPQHNKY
jgi:hypothetical protein